MGWCRPATAAPQCGRLTDKPVLRKQRGSRSGPLEPRAALPHPKNASWPSSCGWLPTPQVQSGCFISVCSCLGRAARSLRRRKGTVR
jgi:hypothetical protein